MCKERLLCLKKMRRIGQELSKEKCEEVLKTEKRGVLSFIDEDGYPYGVPLNFYYENDKIYFHGAKAGKKINILRNSDKASFTVYNQGFKTPDSWAYNPSSVICVGRVSFVEDLLHVIEICREIGQKHASTDEYVEQAISRSIDNVQWLILHIENMSGKIVNES